MIVGIIAICIFSHCVYEVYWKSPNNEAMGLELCRQMPSDSGGGVEHGEERGTE